MRRLNVAICDDDTYFIKIIVSKIISEFENKLDIYTYNNALELIEVINKENDTFHIIFMDIDMPLISGLEASRIIRDKCGNNVIIIFITSYEKYVFDSFEYAPFRFMRKERMEVELSKTLKLALEQWDRKMGREYIILSTAEGKVRVDMSQIYVIERIQRNVSFTLNNGNKYIDLYATIAMLEEKYKDYFVKINSGTLINMESIRVLNDNQIVIVTGEKYHISRRQKKSVNNKLLLYWGEKHNNGGNNDI